LDALAAEGLGSSISLGGAFGLAHYLEYRPTRDVGAWWVEPVEREKRREIIETLEEALRASGEVRTRSWGDVVSVELRQEGRTVFSFQVARRSAELRPPLPSPWPGGIRLDSLEDLIAGKMAALVERGTPRDFRDIYTLCQRELASLTRCWELWEERQRMAKEDTDRRRAALAIRTHLARIEQVRPLSQIADPAERSAAERLRRWFIAEVLRDLPD